MIADVDATFALAMVAVAVAVVVVIVAMSAIGHAVVSIPTFAPRAVAVLLDQTSTHEAGGNQSDQDLHPTTVARKTCDSTYQCRVFTLRDVIVLPRRAVVTAQQVFFTATRGPGVSDGDETQSAWFAICTAPHDDVGLARSDFLCPGYQRVRR